MDNNTFADKMRKMQMSSNSALPAESLAILQLDGKAFRTWTKGLDFPYDNRFVEAMDKVARILAKKISGVQFAYVQSDEINFFVTDLKNLQSEPYYGNRIQKVVSTTAGLASAILTREFPEKDYAVFDGRFFNVPDMEAAEDWFVFRQSDAMKNSVRQVAHSRFFHKELLGKNTLDVKNMLIEVNHPWEDYPEGVKLGRIVEKKFEPKTREFLHKDTKTIETVDYLKSTWVATPAEEFKGHQMFQTLKDSLLNLK